LSNKNGKTPQYEAAEEEDEYSTSSEGEHSLFIEENNESKPEESFIQKAANTNEEKTREETVEEKSLNPTLDNVAALSSRQRSASVSPHVARPVLDFDEVISGKIAPVKSGSNKKRSQTPQKSKRPSVLSEELFKPPEPVKVPEESKLNNLSEVQGSLNLIPENISAKPLDQIIDEVVRVLTLEDIKYRKRKNKCMWKCTAEVGHETVQLELEIMNVKNNMFGIMVRRMQGSFPCYQELYQRIRKELKL